MKQLYLFVAICSAAAAGPALAHVVPPSHFLETAKPYATYEFLIGDWYSKPKGEEVTVHQQFRWGPNKSYITYATYMDVPGKPEQLHFEGMMVWNGKTSALDYLFVVQPGSGVQERGTVRTEPDGSVIREVETIDPKGN